MYKFIIISLLNKTNSNKLYFLKKIVYRWILQKKKHKKLTQNCFLKKKKTEQKQKPANINKKINIWAPKKKKKNEES